MKQTGDKNCRFWVERMHVTLYSLFFWCCCDSWRKAKQTLTATTCFGRVISGVWFYNNSQRPAKQPAATGAELVVKERTLNPSLGLFWWSKWIKNQQRGSFVFWDDRLFWIIWFFFGNDEHLFGFLGTFKNHGGFGLAIFWGWWTIFGDD